MTSPEVEFVLDTIKQNIGPALADIPLERIDRTNSLNLDGGDALSMSRAPHRRSESLEAMTYVGAADVETSRTFVDPDPNYEVDRVVGVRLEGLHVSAGGAIDPYAGTADSETVPWPTTQWTDLKDAITSALTSEIKFPDAGRTGTGYKDLTLVNEADTSRNYGDAYRLDVDVQFMGFEET
jgi:hypothetical protein